MNLILNLIGTAEDETNDIFSFLFNFIFIEEVLAFYLRHIKLYFLNFSFSSLMIIRSL